MRAKLIFMSGKGFELGDQFLDDLSAELAELFVSATMEISQLVVVQAEKV